MLAYRYATAMHIQNIWSLGAGFAVGSSRLNPIKALLSQWLNQLVLSGQGSLAGKLEPQ